jgi:large subunit ribosomal protein L25
MDQKVLNVELREGKGKNACRKVRANGLLPGVIYGKGFEPVAVTMDPRALTAALSGDGGRNNLITLQGDASLAGTMVLVADLLRNPLRGAYRHVDLHKVNLADKVRVEVKVNLVGTAIGVKEGGQLDFPMHKIEIECLPAQIPGHIDVDITALSIGRAIHISELQFPAGVKVLEDPKAAVVSVLGHAATEAAPAA